MSGVVIVGAGHGGSQLAVSLHAEGYAGPVTLIDIESVLPYHKPPLSKTFLKDAAAQPQVLRAEKTYLDGGVERVVGQVTRIDPEARTVSMKERMISYDDLVLATGARNRQLPGLEIATNVFTLRTLDDATRLRSAIAEGDKIVIIGGGFIGLESAAALAAMGKSVTVLEAAPRVLARVASMETSEIVSKSLRGLGIDLRTGFVATDIVQNGRRVTQIASADEAIDADVVIVGIGAVAAAELAREAGIAINLGIITDEALATNVEHVWAIGDVAETPHWQTNGRERVESVQNATDQARTLAKTLATGQRHAFRTVPWFWSDIGQLKLQIAGLSHGADSHIVRRDGSTIAVYHMRGGSLIAVETINSAADHMIARKLLEKGVTPMADQILAGPAALKLLFG